VLPACFIVCRVRVTLARAPVAQSVVGSPSSMRVAGLDIGEKRIGVAVSDALGITAQPVAVVERKSVRRDVEAIRAMLAEHRVGRIVAGLPLQMNGTEGTQAARVRAFADALAAATGVEVSYQDERLTTVQSERLLVESGMRREKRRAVVDKVAAVLILQAWLDAHPGEVAP
jgi:putative Holliday junction resolvase